MYAPPLILTSGKQIVNMYNQLIQSQEVLPRKAGCVSTSPHLNFRYTNSKYNQLIQSQEVLPRKAGCVVCMYYVLVKWLNFQCLLFVLTNCYAKI